MPAGLVIAKGGSWASPQSKDYRYFSARVGTGVEWLYQWSLPGDNGSTKETLALSSPSVPWFVYVESRTRLWFFDGEKNLTYRRWEPSVETGDAIIDGVLKIPAAEVPADLVPNLPQPLQKYFPKGAKPRPSI